MGQRPHVVILGGGFAALETAYLLRMRTHRECERFGAGEPFDAGAAWKAMGVGLRGMAGMLAD